MGTVEGGERERERRGGRGRERERESVGKEFVETRLIEGCPRLEGKSVSSNMAANTNHTTLLKNQSAIKYLP